jgi:hypothetical protein
MIDPQKIIDFPQFLDIYLPQISSDIDNSYKAILRVLFYYIWRGICKSWIELLSLKIETNLAFSCVATYKSFIPIIQNIRLGYISDALILTRSLMERIALIGYLNAFPSQIPKYIANNESLNKKAMPWAISHFPEHFKTPYNILSNIVHARKGGSALYLIENITDPEAYRSIYSNQRNKALTDQAMLLIWREIIVIDFFFSQICGNPTEDNISQDKMIMNYISLEDLNEFRKFLTILVDK